MKFLKICQMKDKRKHAFDIPKIFNTIICHIQKALISTSIKIMCLKSKYFLFTLYIHDPESTLLSQKFFDRHLRK